MLRAAFRNRLSKGTDNEYNHEENANNQSSDSEDEYHDFKMEFSKENDLDKAEVHLAENFGSSFISGKDSEKFPEDSNANSFSKSQIADQEESSLQSRQTQDHSAEEGSLNFPYSEREIYEMQLSLLQEQLVASMISEQEKGEVLMWFIVKVNKNTILLLLICKLMQINYVSLHLTSSKCIAA